MRVIGNMLATIWAPFGTTFVIVSYIFFAIIAILIGSVAGSNIPHSLARIWARLSLLVCGVRVKIYGKEKIPRNRPVVFAANHCSQFDIPIAYKAIPVQFRFLVKQELFKVPILGLAMKIAGYIPIDRSKGRKALKSLNEASKRISSGVSVLIFPEGTRSKDGRLQPLKTGGILLAIKARTPIVPISISGSHKILPKGAWFAKAGKVKVVISDPIDVIDSNGKARAKDEVLHELYEAIKSGLDPENQPLIY